MTAHERTKASRAQPRRPSLLNATPPTRHAPIPLPPSMMPTSPSYHSLLTTSVAWGHMPIASFLATRPTHLVSHASHRIPTGQNQTSPTSQLTTLTLTQTASRTTASSTTPTEPGMTSTRIPRSAPHIPPGAYQAMQSKRLSSTFPLDSLPTYNAAFIKHPLHHATTPPLLATQPSQTSTSHNSARLGPLSLTTSLKTSSPDSVIPRSFTAP